MFHQTRAMVWEHLLPPHAFHPEPTIPALRVTKVAFKIRFLIEEFLDEEPDFEGYFGNSQGWNCGFGVKCVGWEEVFPYHRPRLMEHPGSQLPSNEGGNRGVKGVIEVMGRGGRMRS